jgi:hypothetical protein
MTLNLDDDARFPEAFLNRPDIKLLMEGRLPPMDKIIKLYTNSILNSPEYTTLDTRLRELQTKRMLENTKHMKKPEVMRLHQDIDEQKAKIEKARKTLTSLPIPRQAKQQELVGKLEKQLSKLQSDETELKLGFTFSQESEMASVRGRLDEMKRTLDATLSSVRSSITPINSPPRVSGASFMTPDSPIVGSGRDTSEVNSAVPPPIATLPQPAQSSFEVDLDRYMNTRSERELQLSRNASPTTGSGSASNSPDEREADPRIGKITFALMKEHRPDMFVSKLVYSDPEVFNSTFKLNDFITVDLITRLLDLKTRNVALFQEACSFLARTYQKNLDRRSFLKYDSDEEDADELVELRNQLTINNVEEMLAL